MDQDQFASLQREAFLNCVEEDDVLAGFFAIPNRSRPVLKQGSTGRAVTELQRKLSRLGYTVAASGTFDAATTEALKFFQGGYGLPQTGSTDATTWSTLDSAVQQQTAAEKGQVAAEGGSGSGQFFTGLVQGLTSSMTPAAPEAADEGEDEAKKRKVKGGLNTNTLLIGGAVIGGLVLFGGLVYFATRS